MVNLVCVNRDFESKLDYIITESQIIDENQSLKSNLCF